MNTEELLTRLRKANRTNSLREVGRMCDLSHEAIRKMVLGGKMNVSRDTYNKIDTGLKTNGF